MKEQIVENHPFEPFLPEGARVLMLGTFPPSEKRWSMPFYYPNFSNDMWRIVGLCFFGDKQHFVDGDGRHYRLAELKEFLSEHGIALYDTCTRIVRTKNTASDKDLQVVEQTDVKAMLRRLPQCRIIVTAGQLATTLCAKQLGVEEPGVGAFVQTECEGRNLRLYRMPSSSRAYPMSIERKSEFYQRVFSVISSLCLVLCLMLTLSASAQKRGKYEFMRNLPVYADSLIADLTYPMAWGNSDIKDFGEWRQAARQKVFDCMLTPPPTPPQSPQSREGGYDVEVLFEEQRDGYRARKIEIRLSKYYTVPAYVLIPDGKGPFPAVNALHDHGGHLFIGKEKMIRPLACEDSTVIKDADEWLAGYEGQYFGDYLARHGYVVFSADAPMWGERGQKEGPKRNMYDMIAGNMMMYGIDLSAYMTYDDIAGTEYLASMPEVDPRRIGCTGWSMGAYRAWMLSALSDRIRVGASVCWMVTTDEQMSFKYSRTENGGFANCFPGLRRWMDYPHIASIACPKPMLFINGSQDKLFPVAGVEKAFRIMHDTWESQGAGDKLETELWDMPHSCGKKSQQRVLDFFDKHLKTNKNE